MVDMCRENAFHSIKFSTDINGYLSSLDIAVYLRKSDIGEKDPVCTIRYIPSDYNEGYDIKNNADSFSFSAFKAFMDGIFPSFDCSFKIFRAVS